MTPREIQTLAEKTAELTANIVLQKLGKSQAATENDNLVTAAEAARMLGITPAYMRTIKDRFPHVKLGNTTQGRILFKRNELLANY